MGPTEGLVATARDLPPQVASALASPAPGDESAINGGGLRWRFRSWGDPADPPLLLVHGITSNADSWWRVGPALAAAGQRAVAVDMPGHGPAAAWNGRHRLIETAEELARFIAHADLAHPRLAVVGHSWGGMVVAHLPQVGVRPAPLVLLDPPWLALDDLAALTLEPTERHYDSVEDAAVAVRAVNTSWSDGDVMAKARGLTQYNVDAVQSILVENGPMDAGLTALRHPSARAMSVWLIRGEPSAGGLVPDSAAAQFRELLGPGRVITIANASHSPQRTHPEATVLAILQSLSTSTKGGQDGFTAA